MDSCEEEYDQESSSESKDEDDGLDFCHTMGSMTVVNGSFIAHTLDLGLTLEEATAMLEVEFGEEKESENEESDTDNEVYLYYGAQSQSKLIHSIELGL